MTSSTYRTQQLLQRYIKLKMKQSILKDHIKAIQQRHLHITPANTTAI